MAYEKTWGEERIANELKLKLGMRVSCWILAMFLEIDLGHETRSVWQKRVRAAVRRLL
jgi:hypothetical protein